MKKPSKNTGITKCCPHYKKTLLKEINVGEGSLKLKCPYCGERLTVEVIKKITVNIKTIQS